MFSLNNRVVLLSGGAGGIGQKIAEIMINNGSKVILTGTNKDKLKFLSSKLGENSHYIVANLENSDDIDNLSKNAEEIYGQVDILINNAGITSDNLFLRMKDEEWDKVLNINLHGSIKLTKRIVRGMIKRRYGRVIFISSIIAFTGNIGQSNYSASKSALSGFTKSLSIEVANRGITCNLIAPGFIQSPMTDKLSDEQKKAILERIPVSRFGTPIDVASACLYLSSDEASFVTGSTMHVNGGMGMF